MRRPAASMTRWSALVAPWGRGPSQIIPSVVKVPLRFCLHAFDLRVVVAGHEHDGCVDAGGDVLDVVPGQVAGREHQVGGEVAQGLDREVGGLFVSDHQYSNHPSRLTGTRPACTRR